MREIPFANLQDINKYQHERPIVLFGAGNISSKTRRLLHDKELAAIADNASNHWGTEQLGVEVKNPEFLNGNRDKYYVVICTTSFAEVSSQLQSFGFKGMEDFIVSPILNDLRIISELEDIQKELIFTSGSPAQEDESYGGGVYSMTVNGDTWQHKKQISGNCYGLIRFNDNFISVNTELGIFEFDKDFNIVRNKVLPADTRGHGVAYSEDLKRFYIVGSYIDGVLVLDERFNIIDSIHFSDKRNYYKAPAHHCNDCCLVGNSLYVSMFSVTGNWKHDIFDGGVVEIDITNHQITGTVIKDLWMPHNVEFIGGGLVVLDSLRGALRKNNAQIVGEFPAFTRGLDHDGLHFYIGQSRNRNFSKNLGISNNISIDAGIVIFDEHTKVSRTLQLPPKISEIHSICLL